jgi:hypothetical protein
MCELDPRSESLAEVCWKGGKGGERVGGKGANLNAALLFLISLCGPLARLCHQSQRPKTVEAATRKLASGCRLVDWL